MATELVPVKSNLKIVFNGLPAVYPISGVGRYTLELGRALENCLGRESIFWFGNHFAGRGQGYSDQKYPRFINQVQTHVKRGLRDVPAFRTFHRFWRNCLFKVYIKNVKPSLYHETNYIPFDFEEGPTLITIYDLSFIRHPEWHPKSRVKYFEKYFLQKLSQAKLIVTISEFSKKEITDLLGINPAKIYVTYPGVDRGFTPEGEKMKGLPNEYILFVGNIEPRKNLVTLLDAYRSLPQSLKRRFPLVIAGASGWHTRELEKALQLFPQEEKPFLIGYIPQNILPQLYRGASLFVYPSFYEGFGLPVLEAMASGVPVLASNTASLPELVGNAGRLVNPDDMNEFKSAMVELLGNKRIRGEMLDKGLERANLFSWEKCAQETLRVYKEVSGL